MIPIEKILILNQCPLFETLSTEHLSHITSLFKDIQFKNNTIIYQINDTSDGLYILCEGSVSMEFYHPRSLTINIMVNHGFGHFDLMGINKRLSKATTKTDCDCLYINKNDLLKLGSQYPSISIAMLDQLTYLLNDFSI